ncbi:MAG: RluA family pseudouridine synthase [Candidatus Gracilibacteria bacterium]|nr:RluA family pseudouridine synthase [Candidatus Gracilibacteria bacterium]
MKYTVESHETGWRLDQFLVGRTELSRSQITKFIKQDKVKMRGKVVNKAGLVLEEGQEVYFSRPKDESPTVQAEEGNLDIVYEDEDLMVVNKPAGIVVHPAPGYRQGTLANFIKSHLAKDLSQVEGFVRPGIVHRLDRDTSGLIVIAKNSASQKNLANQFKDRIVKKKYLTLVLGHLEPKQGTIDSPIARHQLDRQKMAVSSAAGAKEAITHYKVIANYKLYSLLEVRIEQGRTHQIRVHLSAIDHPVIGDEKYGDIKVNKHAGLSRQFLHAAALSFLHPADGRKLEFEASLPEDLQGFLDELS